MYVSHEQTLKGTRTAASELVVQIQQELIRYGKTGHKDASRHQLKYSFNILRSICIAVDTPQGIHYDIYCDIFERVLAPCLKPAASPTLWGVFLENVRFLHHLLVNKRLFAESSRIYTWLAAQSDKLQNETDYKPILATYSLHLLLQRAHLQKDAEAAQREIPHILNALTELFRTMLRHNKEQNFTYIDLLRVFVQCLCKQPANVLNFLSTSLLEHKSKVHETFFDLLVGLKSAQQEPSVDLHCQQHLEAFVSFVQLDLGAKLQQQIAVQHLRACCELRVVQSDKGIGYTMNLLYYYVKFVYSQIKYNNFTRSYMELCGKIINFFEKSGDVLLQQKWFMDLVVALGMLLMQTHHRSSSCFDVFWQQMNCIDCFAAHFELMLCCIKLAPRITESKLAPWICCSSVRKHVILSYAQSALGAYSYFVLNVPEESADKQQQKRLDDLNRTFTAIVRHAVNVINSMSCIADVSTNSSSATSLQELKIFYARFAQLTRDIKTPAQAIFCVNLSDALEKLQTKFTATDWTLLLRRIYKTAELSADAVLTAELHSCYIATLLQEVPQSDITLLRNQIAIFHSKPTDKCLLEWLVQCRSVLKPELQLQQQRLLHWLETQHLFKYQKANEKLQLSLLRNCRTQYEHVLVVHAAKMNASGAGQLSVMREALRQKSLSALGRLEQLTLAHACTLLLHEQTNVQKKAPDFETKDCLEEKMDDLLLRKEFQSINVATEMETIDLALEALHAFAAFYNKADLEYISSDVAYIDWEFIVEDVGALAMFLQFAGYLVYATEAWTLYYRICNNIEDHNNSLRALAYFCEHAEAIEDAQEVKSSVNLQREVANKLPIILNFLQSNVQLPKRQQTLVLLCLCQLSYFYARLGNFSYAQMLLQLVQQKHNELPERQGKYDLVLSTMETVRMRILWKHLDNLRSVGLEKESAQVLLLQQGLLRELELTLDNFREFVYISSSDTLPYMILLLSLTQQAAECTANRLYDYHINYLFVSVLKIALHSGMALRIVQILTAWMWSNLQMEYVAKAQTKLKIIECVLGVKNIRELATPIFKAVAKTPLKKCESLVEPISESLFVPVSVAAGVEAMRKVVPLQSSPIKINKMQLSPSTWNSNLKRFLSYSHNGTLKNNELLQWFYFAVGCLNARLYFLIDEYEQLDDFYENCMHWLEEMKNTRQVRSFQNFQLLCIQHYANYLRAQKRHEKAHSILESALDKCGEQSRIVDSMYCLNLLLQLRATEREIAHKQISDSEKSNRAQLRRSFEFNKSFNVSFDDKRMVRTVKKPSQTKTAICKLYASTTSKKIKCASKDTAFVIYNSDEDVEDQPCMRKELFRKKTGSRGSQSSQDDNKSLIQQKTVIDLYKSTKADALNLCQAIELIDLDDSKDECSVSQPAPVAKAIAAAANENRKRSPTHIAARTPKPLAAVIGRTLKSETYDKIATPKIRQVTVSTLDAGMSAKQSVASILASGTATSAKRGSRRNGRTCADLITEVIVLDNSSTMLKASPLQAGSTKEKETAAVEVLLKKMRSLEVTPAKARTPTDSRRPRGRARKPPLLKQACIKACNSGNSPSNDVHTPAVATTQLPKTHSKSKQPVASAAVEMPSATAPVTDRRIRGRPRKIAVENNENIDPITLSPCNATSKVVIRRRQRT